VKVDEEEEVLSREERRDIMGVLMVEEVLLTNFIKKRKCVYLYLRSF